MAKPEPPGSTADTRSTGAWAPPSSKGEAEPVQSARAAPLWASIRDALGADLAAGRYGAGDRLPSENLLARRFGVNRHTVRRALAALSEAGAIHVRRGAGATVTGAPISYAIGARTRFSDNLRDSGRTPQERVLRAETLRADPELAGLLALSPGAAVHVAETVGLADDVPVSHATRFYPAERFPGLLEALAELGSASAALTACGLPDYRRAWTRMAAEAATAEIAAHLWLEPGAPLLATRSLNVDAAGGAVEYGHTRFAGGRVELSVEDPRSPPQEAAAPQRKP
ncbi:MAG: phosphonate metabolism transcriptional regulator PhnF [Pseudomonadota bacterium]